MDADWQEIEHRVGMAVFHFGKVATISAPDEYVTSMAIRHAILCGEREIDHAFATLRRVHAKGAGISVLPDSTRRAYLRVRALGYEDIANPSDINPVTLVYAIAATRVMAEFLQDDFQQIRREIIGV